MKIILLINLCLVSYGKNDNSCLDCSFNIAANNIDDIHIQSCPIPHIQSTNEISAISCIDGSQNGYYTMNECDITTGTTTFDDSPFDLTIVRRRQLSSTNMISNYLIQTCITYDIIGFECLNVKGVFLPLCSNTNTSKLTPSDINQLIMNETFDNGNNIKNAIGANINGNLGILVELINVDSFEICIGNIIVNKHDLHNIYTHRGIETSDGNIIGSSGLNTKAVYCDINGLPCFNFLFREQCSEDTIIANEIESEIEVMETTEIVHKIDDKSTNFTDVDMHYNLIIDFSDSAFVYLWSIVLFIIGIISLNIILYHYFSTSELYHYSSEQGEGEGEESEISDIEVV